MKLQGCETHSPVYDCVRPQKKLRACVGSTGRARALRIDRADMHACMLARSGGGRNRYSKGQGILLQAVTAGKGYGTDQAWKMEGGHCTVRM